MLRRCALQANATRDKSPGGYRVGGAAHAFVFSVLSARPAAAGAKLVRLGVIMHTGDVWPVANGHFDAGTEVMMNAGEDINADELLVQTRLAPDGGSQLCLQRAGAPSSCFVSASFGGKGKLEWEENAGAGVLRVVRSRASWLAGLSPALSAALAHRRHEA